MEKSQNEAFALSGRRHPEAANAREKNMPHLGRDSTTGSPPAIRVIDASRHRTMPWKNGFGTTTEIAIDPPGADLGGRFRWRLSIAAVQRSGPFSAFPGYERTIMVIEGRGMELTVGGDPPRRLDQLFEPFVFSGDAPTQCRLLDGPVRDLNLMADRSGLRSQMDVVRLDSIRPVDLPPLVRVIHCLDGAIDLKGGSFHGPVRLGASDTAVLGHGGSFGCGMHLAPELGRHATIAVIELAPRVPAA